MGKVVPGTAACCPAPPTGAHPRVPAFPAPQGLSGLSPMQLPMPGEGPRCCNNAGLLINNTEPGLCLQASFTQAFPPGTGKPPLYTQSSHPGCPMGPPRPPTSLYPSSSPAKVALGAGFGCSPQKICPQARVGRCGISRPAPSRKSWVRAASDTSVTSEIFCFHFVHKKCF